MDNQGPVDERVDPSITRDETGTSSPDNSGKQPKAAAKTLIGRLRERWLDKRGLKHALWGVVGFLALLLIAGNAYIFIAGISIFQISGNSMEPTLKSGNAVIIKQETFVKKDLIIFFSKPNGWISTGNGNHSTIVKRIVAIPGDRLAFDGKSFRVNDEIVYNLSDDNYECSNAPQDYSVRLNKQQVFVMGDNAKESIDSRKMFCEGKIDDMFINNKVIINFGTIKWQF